MQKNIVKKKNSTFKLLFKVWININSRLKKETYFALFTMIMSAFFESISLAAFLPFLTLVILVSIFPLMFFYFAFF